MTELKTRWDIKKIYMQQNIFEWEEAYLYMSLNDTDKDKITHLLIIGGNSSKIRLELLIQA